MRTGTQAPERNDPVSCAHRGPVSRWRVALFAFMSQNSAHAIDRFKDTHGRPDGNRRADRDLENSEILIAFPSTDYFEGNNLREGLPLRP
jgi:hypothetical protein